MGTKIKKFNSDMSLLEILQNAFKNDEISFSFVRTPYDHIEVNQKIEPELYEKRLVEYCGAKRQICTDDNEIWGTILDSEFTENGKAYALEINNEEFFIYYPDTNIIHFC